MAFGQDFETKFNENMQNGQPGRAPTEAEDYEMDKKKDAPPRFSTLFAPAPQPPPQPPREYVQEYYPRPEKKKGVFLPMPLFIVFAVILFFESTILFAYTVIGLYNNAPARLFPWAGQGTSTAACDCGERHPAVNISPNFMLPQGAEPLTTAVTVTITPTGSVLSSLTTSSTSSSSSPVATVTYTPPRSTVDITTVITQGASDTKSEAPAPTVTMTTLVPPPSSSASETTSTSGTSTSSYNSAAWASVSSVNAAIESALTPDPVPSTKSALETSTSTTPEPTTTEEPTSTSTSQVTSATGRVCFGGSGGVQLTCE